jgi:hypothetical protein
VPYYKSNGANNKGKRHKKGGSHNESRHKLQHVDILVAINFAKAVSRSITPFGELHFDEDFIITPAKP